MPKCTWEQISDIKHRCQNTLELAYMIEKEATTIKTGKKLLIIEYSVKLRKKIGAELEKLNDIVLQQIEPQKGENNDETNYH